MKFGVVIRNMGPQSTQETIAACARAVEDCGFDAAFVVDLDFIQHFTHAGKRLGHLLNPRTAWPAEGMLSATVTAPTAAEADALATAFFILGVEKARVYCDAHPDIGAALITAAEPESIDKLGHAIHEVDIQR